MRRWPPTSVSITTSSLRSTLVSVGVGVVLVVRVAAGQGLTANEADVGIAAAWARRDFYGVSVGIARRPSSQGRAALSAAGGSVNGDAGLRLELSGQFLVLPDARRGLSPYIGLGLGYVAARHVRGTGVLVALVGLEAPEGRRAGWFAELGFGGGARMRAGYRWRWLPAWWT